MTGYTVPETRANSSSKTGSGIFWLEYRSHIMSFPCGAPCNKTTFKQLSGSRSQGGPWKAGSSFKLPASSPRGCHVWGKSSFGDLAGIQDCFHDSKAHLSCEYYLRSSLLGAESLPLSCAPLKVYSPLGGENGECIPHFSV